MTSMPKRRRVECGVESRCTLWKVIRIMDRRGSFRSLADSNGGPKARNLTPYVVIN